MYWIKLVLLGFIILGVTALASAQGVIDDVGKGTANHNYFVANQKDDLKLLLFQVETHHLKPCPHSDSGIYEDIAKGRYDYAQGDLTYILERFVNHPIALQLITPVAHATRQSGWGIQWFEHALKLYPKYAVTIAQYGSYLVEIGDGPAGIEKLESATKMDSKLTAAYVWLSKAYTKEGNLKAARQAADKARELGYKGRL
jgi:predicted Zn-dependent protease